MKASGWGVRSYQLQENQVAPIRKSSHLFPEDNPKFQFMDLWNNIANLSQLCQPLFFTTLLDAGFFLHYVVLC